MAVCAVCGKRVSFFSERSVRDGKVCLNCLRAILPTDAEKFTKDEIRRFDAIYDARKSAFRETGSFVTSYSGVVKIDEENRLLCYDDAYVGTKYYAFDELREYSFAEEPCETTPAELGSRKRAETSDLLTGRYGALFGIPAARQDEDTLQCHALLRICAYDGEHTLRISGEPDAVAAFLERCFP